MRIDQWSFREEEDISVVAESKPTSLFSIAASSYPAVQKIKQKVDLDSSSHFLHLAL